MLCMLNQECTTYFSARWTLVYVYCLATDVTKLHCITNRLTTTMPVIIALFCFLLSCTFLFQYLDIIILAIGNYSRAIWPNEGAARTSNSLQYQNIDCLTILSLQVSHQTVQNRFYWQ